MALTWTKSWSSADDGSVLGGADLDNIQNDLDSQAMTLAVTQTVTGNKTFSGTNTHSGTNTFSGANTFSNTNAFSSTCTFSGQVVFTNKSAITCLSSTSVDMKTTGVTNLYTVPTGKTMIVTHIIVRSVSATLASGTDYDFGTVSACSSWRQSVSLTSMTATTDVMVITPADVTKYTNNAADSIFGIKVTTGSAGAATATIDLFGYLF